MRVFLLIIFIGIGLIGFGQPKILHYSETSGYDHQTRSASLLMFQSIASIEGYVVEDDQTGDAFNSIASVQEYELIVFSNTSGDAILNANQRSNFESYIANGGSYLGIHAATDTYRHSTANGSNTGAWDFYAKLVGASVQQSPNHVSGTPAYSMGLVGFHESTQNLPSPWVKNEEYYYWENGFFGLNNNPVLEVEETIGPNNMINSYDAVRPMSWYRELPTGGKMFYTAIGHSVSNYGSDQNFVQHISDAVNWIMSETVDIAETTEEISFSTSQQSGMVNIRFNSTPPSYHVSLYNSYGQLVRSLSSQSIVNTIGLPSGFYFLKVNYNDIEVAKKLIIQD